MYLTGISTRQTGRTVYRQAESVSRYGNIQDDSDTDVSTTDLVRTIPNNCNNSPTPVQVKIYKLFSLYLLIPVVASVLCMYVVSDKMCIDSFPNATIKSNVINGSSNRLTCMRITVAVAFLCAIISLFVSAWYERKYRRYKNVIKQQIPGFNQY